MSQLVLSLFPGIGLLDRAFEETGFCVVRGPDLLWGGDIHRFRPPAGRFDGVIGGPPCQRFSPMGNVNRARWGEDSVMPDLIPEFARVVLEADPQWWIMENSPNAYTPLPDARQVLIDNAWLGEEQGRLRAFWSNLRLDIEFPVFGNQTPVHTVCSRGAVDWKGSRARRGERPIAEMLRLQGFPEDMLDRAPFTAGGAKQAIGNGVPLPMGRAIARAVAEAIGAERLAVQG